MAIPFRPSMTEIQTPKMTMRIPIVILMGKTDQKKAE
jgi:hypothetical protein